MAENNVNIEKWSTLKEVQERYRIYDENGQFRAIYQKKGREYHVVKMF